MPPCKNKQEARTLAVTSAVRIWKDSEPYIENHLTKSKDKIIQH